MEIDVERQQKAREYAKIRRWLSFVDLGIRGGWLAHYICSGPG